MSPDDLRALGQVLEAIGRSADDRLFITTALFAKLDRPADIEPLLQGAPDRDAAWSVVAAAVQLARGQHVVLTQHGFTTSLAAMSDERVVAALGAINRFLATLQQRFGIAAYYTSGTLLGLVRTGRLIAHDDDIDTAYVSAETNMVNVVLERLELMRFINGLPDHRADDHLPGLLHCYIPMEGGQRFRFDLFTGWVEDGFVAEYPLPRRQLATASVLPLRTDHHYGLPLPVPAAPEDLLLVNYGPRWRTPDPGFRFDWSAAGRAYGSTLEGFRWTAAAQQRHWLDRETRGMSAATVPGAAMAAWQAAGPATEVAWVPQAPPHAATVVAAAGEAGVDFGFVQSPGLLFLRGVCTRAGAADAYVDHLLKAAPGTNNRARIQARLGDGSLVVAMEPRP